MDRVRLRKATGADAATVLAFIRRLAEYEKLSHACVATEEKLARTLFGERRYAEVLLAEADGEAVGYAIYYYHYSTFNAAPSLWLEDLFVDPSHRGSGTGKALLRELCRIARDEGCERVEWWVLDWNEPSIKFYESIGAKPMSDWTVYRMDEDAIQSFVGA
ncbi:MAG: GNAT family N-acetyltransferase [Armatimonadetes bacterium]|nr:GNAT family N-acetyltransferase [Armatimonadota bacterium]